MKAGDKYVVPKDAINPMIVTGRPLMLTVSIDGKEVAPLGTAERTIADVGVSAAKLAARTAPQQGAGTAATSGPSASASSAPAIEP